MFVFLFSRIKDENYEILPTIADESGVVYGEGERDTGGSSEIGNMAYQIYQDLFSTQPI